MGGPALLLIALLAAPHGPVNHRLSAMALLQAAWTPEAPGDSHQVDLVVGLQMGYAPRLGRAGDLVELQLSFKAGTLGASSDHGTDALRVSSTDLRLGLGAFLRYPFVLLPELRLLPGVLLVWDNSVQLINIELQGQRERRVAYLPGLGYGLRLQFEWRGWAVAPVFLAVSHFEATGTPETGYFFGFNGGYVFRF